jgi:hypothetical protein
MQVDHMYTTTVFSCYSKYVYHIENSLTFPTHSSVTSEICTHADTAIFCVLEQLLLSLLVATYDLNASLSSPPLHHTVHSTTILKPLLSFHSMSVSLTQPHASTLMYVYAHHLHSLRLNSKLHSATISLS